MYSLKWKKVTEIGVTWGRWWSQMKKSSELNTLVYNVSFIL